MKSEFVEHFFPLSYPLPTLVSRCVNSITFHQVPKTLSGQKIWRQLANGGKSPCKSRTPSSLLVYQHIQNGSESRCLLWLGSSSFQSIQWTSNPIWTSSSHCISNKSLYKVVLFTPWCGLRVETWYLPKFRLHGTSITYPYLNQTHSAFI